MSHQGRRMSDNLLSRRGLWLVLPLLLSACGTFQPKVVQDSGPTRPVDVSHIPDAVPRHETRTRAGNKSPYTVLGKTYRVLPDSRGFVEQGFASWYGNKFHGRQTSNGEVYNMYGMTAAHKNLPIPSYVKVTNLENNRQIVVRVNDRGPFHEGRVIDLSYAGASKLGFLDRGTARVKVEAVEPVQVSVSEPTKSAGHQLPANTFLQAGAFSSAGAAESLRQTLQGLTPLSVVVVQPAADRFYRVRVGPIASSLALMDVRAAMQRHKLPAPHVIYD